MAMKKTFKKVFTLLCISGIAAIAGMVLKKDSVKDKLFELLGEDTYLALDDKAHLLGDLLMWPIDFVRALLP